MTEGIIIGDVLSSSGVTSPIFELKSRLSSPVEAHTHSGQRHPSLDLQMHSAAVRAVAA